MTIKSGSKRWYDAYIPFVARSAESQIVWLVAAFQKEVLSSQEITPYIRLLLTEDTPGKHDTLIELFRLLDEKVLVKMLESADIYDVPKLFPLISRPTVQQAVIALQKCPPPYEKAPQILLDKVFQAIYNFSESLLNEAVAALRHQGGVPGCFEKAYERFQEIIEDQKLITSLYPKARVDR